MPVVVMSGVSRGLGRAMTARFIEAGWTVAGCGRSEDRLQQLTAQYPAPHRFNVLDVGDDVAVGHWARQTLRDVGPPDLLVNNAAIINTNAPLWEVPSEEFAALLTVNVQGVHSVIRHFVPAMIERRKGVIVNFSSGWGRSTSPEVAPYCATKWAIEGLSRALAQELPRGMACVALNPGIIDTEMLRRCFGAGASHYPSADTWSQSAVPFLMQLSAQDNGNSLTAPGA